MPTILLIDNDRVFQKKLKQSFENLENEFFIALPGEEAIEKYEGYNPDLVLMNYAHCKETADIMFRDILEFDATAGIVSLLNDEVEDQVHQMYLKGARSTIKIPNELKTKKEVDMIMDQLFKICDGLKFDNCIGCWKTNKFISTIKLH